MAEADLERVIDAFPLVDAIGDDALRTGVIEAWDRTLRETEIPLEEFPWSLKVQSELSLDDLYLVDHINDVAEVSVRNAQYITEEMNIDVDLDIVIAGALVHDISKPYEFTDGHERVDELLGHPYYGIYISERAGFPIEVTHIVLSHTHQTPVEPRTLEAQIVSKSDELAADALRSQR